jgi:hypothetical protein
MIRAACHCGAVHITLNPDPTWGGDCNCSICRRYGTLWAYSRDFQNPARRIETTLVQGLEDLEAYVWGRRELAFWRCRHCGCVTHHTLVDQPTNIRGANARMFIDFDPARVILNRSDNAHTGWFWTRPDAEIWKGPQPVEPPDPDGWR